MYRIYKYFVCCRCILVLCVSAIKHGNSEVTGICGSCVDVVGCFLFVGSVSVCWLFLCFLCGCVVFLVYCYVSLVMLYLVYFIRCDVM